MGKLTTHVLDTANGCPAAGMRSRFYRIENGGAHELQGLALNPDGRADAPLLEGSEHRAGPLRLVFAVAAYFRGARHRSSPSPPFLDEVPLDFGIANADEHYHVPLLASPWAYSTYRGS